ncbi:hypothetical protein N7462_011208 [Penicillium macrosclerotiorum]|uniref:uncharacterized protein n=1 Tax=Penicillium macrosclerotiorum TaxID=303699 RepID=UPI0025492EF4|nr:uncharacterized protein N7462_011208 [Penicillium macrosclerotiorum]KAJ5666799.1 hypothetical protein N7462_011208 [Penicillium macrosclerotiorum]
MAGGTDGKEEEEKEVWSVEDITSYEGAMAHPAAPPHRTAPPRIPSGIHLGPKCALCGRRK